MLGLHSPLHPMGQQPWDQVYASSKDIYLNELYAAQKQPLLLIKATNSSRELQDSYDEALKKYSILLMLTLPYVVNNHAAPDAMPLEHISKQI